MSNQKYNQNLLIGAAVAAGILGTLTSLLGLKKNQKGWPDKAKEVANQVLEGEMVNKKMLLGGVAGGLIGATAALLLAPKSGSELIDDIANTFSQSEEHHPSSRRLKGQKIKKSRKVKHGAAEHAITQVTKKRKSKSSGKRKSVRHKTAALASHSHAPSSHEKAAISEVS